MKICGLVLLCLCAAGYKFRTQLGIQKFLPFLPGSLAGKGEENTRKTARQNGSEETTPEKQKKPSAEEFEAKVKRSKEAVKKWKTALNNIKSKQLTPASEKPSGPSSVTCTNNQYFWWENKLRADESTKLEPYFIAYDETTKDNGYECSCYGELGDDEDGVWDPARPGAYAPAIDFMIGFKSAGGAHECKTEEGKLSVTCLGCLEQNIVQTINESQGKCATITCKDVTKRCSGKELSEKTIALFLSDRKHHRYKFKDLRIQRETMIYKSIPGVRVCPHCDYVQNSYSDHSGTTLKYKSDTDVRAKIKQDPKHARATCYNQSCKKDLCRNSKCIEKGKPPKWTVHGRGHKCMVQKESFLSKKMHRNECIRSNINLCPSCQTPATRGGGPGCNYIVCERCSTPFSVPEFCVYCGTKSKGHLHNNSDGCCQPSFMARNWEAVNAKIVKMFPQWKLEAGLAQTFEITDGSGVTELGTRESADLINVEAIGHGSCSGNGISFDVKVGNKRVTQIRIKRNGSGYKVGDCVTLEGALTGSDHDVRVQITGVFNEKDELQAYEQSWIDQMYHLRPIGRELRNGDKVRFFQHPEREPGALGDYGRARWPEREGVIIEKTDSNGARIQVHKFKGPSQKAECVAFTDEFGKRKEIWVKHEELYVLNRPRNCEVESDTANILPGDPRIGSSRVVYRVRVDHPTHGGRLARTCASSGRDEYTLTLSEAFADRILPETKVEKVKRGDFEILSQGSDKWGEAHPRSGCYKTPDGLWKDFEDRMPSDDDGTPKGKAKAWICFK